MCSDHLEGSQSSPHVPLWLHPWFRVLTSCDADYAAAQHSMAKPQRNLSETSRCFEAQRLAYATLWQHFCSMIYNCSPLYNHCRTGPMLKHLHRASLSQQCYLDSAPRNLMKPLSTDVVLRNMPPPASPRSASSALAMISSRSSPARQPAHITCRECRAWFGWWWTWVRA